MSPSDATVPPLHRFSDGDRWFLGGLATAIIGGVWLASTSDFLELAGIFVLGVGVALAIGSSKVR